MQRYQPRDVRLTLTGIAWLCLAGYLIFASIPELVVSQLEFPLLGVPVFGLVSVVAAIGLIARRSFARGTILFLAGLGLLFALASFGRHAPWSFQFVLALSVLFFAWSIVLVVWMWPAGPKQRVAAG